MVLTSSTLSLGARKQQHVLRSNLADTLRLNGDLVMIYTWHLAVTAAGKDLAVISTEHDTFSTIQISYLVKKDAESSLTPIVMSHCLTYACLNATF